MWRPDETSEEATRPDVMGGLFWLALVDGEPQGTLKFQLSDPEFWPEFKGQDSAFLHRLAVRRALPGSGLSSAMMRGRQTELARFVGVIFDWIAIRAE